MLENALDDALNFATDVDTVDHNSLIERFRQVLVSLGLPWTGAPPLILAGANVCHFVPSCLKLLPSPVVCQRVLI